MTASRDFVSVGENIHCTRIYKVGGEFVKESGSGYAISYTAGKEKRQLPIPAAFTQTADWQAGRIKHCCVAIWQGVYGKGQDQQTGIDYLKSLGQGQEAAGATYLDINVDEFSTDVAERVRLMQWTVKTVQEAVRIPMSIDSSNVEILTAGLSACDTKRGAPMVNSVSLERTDAIKVAAKFNAVVIASAAGEKDLPQNTPERMQNLERLMPMLTAAGFKAPQIHIDPLVFPISVDATNGRGFLDACTEIRKRFGQEIHIVAGLSNVSFGMPKRKLINQVFTALAIDAGADGGIVDPHQISPKILAKLDRNSEGFKLASALLLGEDEYGMEFISACREERI